VRLIFGPTGQPIRHISQIDYEPSEVPVTWGEGIGRYTACGIVITQPQPAHLNVGSWQVSWERIHEPTASFIHDQLTGYDGGAPPWKLCLDCILALIS
jgi:hypothetical protein